MCYLKTTTMPVSGGSPRYAVERERDKHIKKDSWHSQFTLNHHHHVVPLTWISLTLSRHFSILFIAFGRSSGVHLVSSQSCCMYVRAGRPAFARFYMWGSIGVHHL